MACYFLQPLNENGKRINTKTICKAITKLTYAENFYCFLFYNCATRSTRIFSHETNNYVKISEEFFQHFSWSGFLRNSETFLQIADERIQLKAEACHFHLEGSQSIANICCHVFFPWRFYWFAVTPKSVANSTLF